MTELSKSSKHARTIPSTGSLVVDASEKYPGSFANISSAVLNLHNNTNPQTIFIFPGKYVEQVHIKSLLGPLTIQGYTQDARSYEENEVTISYNLSRQNPNLTNNDQTSTVRLWTSNVKFYNLDIANTFGQAESKGQALALSAQKTNQGFYGCRFTGYQDTIYANEGRQIYAKSYVNGAVDFIFGLRASAWFDKIDIEVIGEGWITANGREAANNTSFYVFNKVNVTGGEPNTVYLGRPWRDFSRVVFQRSYLGDVVRPEGWAAWDEEQNLENISYGEFKNHGPGAVIANRANFSTQLKNPIKAAEILGNKFEKEFWVDETYLS
ncbi:carbohydrate esterase family 8 protein-like protein [Corynespora cassiicola Philippines]|uniref:Pectinesterase n=1 Tax=Corynespora cassiicola Philippines TaxID=1448308 RepID=A0A2T2N4C9_CORCC|nr:carbohydrate esterase family 8 protein-like protein [Corynespora cassiicola Philippines]